MVECAAASTWARRAAAGARDRGESGCGPAREPGAMKFGKLLRGTVDARMPQWRDYVLQFKGLKQHIKQAQAALAAQGACCRSTHVALVGPGGGADASDELMTPRCTAMPLPQTALPPHARRRLWSVREQACRWTTPVPHSPRCSTRRSRR